MKSLLALVEEAPGENGNLTCYERLKEPVRHMNRSME